MSEQINEQAEKMREMAQTTLDKAKDAVSKVAPSRSTNATMTWSPESGAGTP